MQLKFTSNDFTSGYMNLDAYDENRTKKMDRTGKYEFKFIPTILEDPPVGHSLAMWIMFISPSIPFS